MPPQKQPLLEIPLSGSLDEGTGRLFRGPGKFSRLENVDQTQTGYLAKRRGYRLINFSRTTGGVVPGNIVEAVATYQGELVVFGQKLVYAVHQDTDLEDDAQITERGPALSGNWRRTDLVGGGIGD